MNNNFKLFLNSTKEEKNNSISILNTVFIKVYVLFYRFQHFLKALKVLSFRKM
jgi:hypothetical protein